MWKSIFKRKAPGGSGYLPGRAPGPVARWLVGRLQWVERRLTTRQKKILFASYVGAFATGCILAVTGPFRSGGDDMGSLEFGNIKGTAGAYPSEPAAGFGADSLRLQILGYKAFLDSLRADPGGRSYYDSLIKAQPGFIDTLENVASYLQSLKN